MRTVRIKLYKYNELNEQAKKTAIAKFFDVNVDYEWWDSIYSDANEIGLKITEFDADTYCKGKLLHSLPEVCNLIMSNHGEQCETYKTAKAYLAEWDKLVKEHSDGIIPDKVSEDKEYEFDQCADELENQLKLSLCEDYRVILRNEYEYLTSTEAIEETILYNEYDFTQDGKFFTNH